MFVCISPWNFPLAIFAGQVVAALVAGNTVAAKPAEQTPVVARRFVALLHEVGVPADAVQWLHGPGETVGAALVADARTAGVCFTGSTQVARFINRSLAAKDGPIVPLIAETGGLNAMIVDSTALPEQVVDAVVQSAFRSAGQRCSALRLLCVHEAIADGVIEMLRGALAELRVDDPSLLATDVGPVIDDEAFANITRHVERLRRDARLLGETTVTSRVPHLVAPVAFEIAAVADLREEIFGPVLHVVRWGGEVAALVAADQRPRLRPDARRADAHRQPRRAHCRQRARRQCLCQPQHDRRSGRRAALRRRGHERHRPEGRWAALPAAFCGAAVGGVGRASCCRMGHRVRRGLVDRTARRISNVVGAGVARTGRGRAAGSAAADG